MFHYIWFWFCLASCFVHSKKILSLLPGATSRPIVFAGWENILHMLRHCFGRSLGLSQGGREAVAGRFSSDFSVSQLTVQGVSSTSCI